MNYSEFVLLTCYSNITFSSFLTNKLQGSLPLQTQKSFSFNFCGFFFLNWLLGRAYDVLRK